MLEQNKPPPFGTSRGYPSGVPRTKGRSEVPARKKKKGRDKEKKRSLVEAIDSPKPEKYSFSSVVLALSPLLQP